MNDEPGALIIGASIAGLASALALQRLGVNVRVLERSPGAPVDRGAGLGLDAGLLRATLGARAEAMPTLRLRGRVLHRAFPSHDRAPMRVERVREAGDLLVSTWQQLHTALRESVHAPIEHGHAIARVHIEPNGRAIAIDGQGVAHSAALLVGADGHDSVARAAVADDASPEYAGYFLWRGFVDEPALDPALRPLFFDGHLHLFALAPFHFVAYEVPAAHAGAPRRLNWGWYAAVNDEERARLVERAGLPDHALVLPPRKLAAPDRAHWVRLAERVWPAPWAALVAQTDAAGAMFGNAIHELAPARLSRGHAVLVGDAAHLMSPITGSGARLALADALALGAAIADTDGDRARALQRYDAQQVQAGAQALASARAWARSALRASPRLGNAASALTRNAITSQLEQETAP